jgi:hypothetical protein
MAAAKPKRNTRLTAEGSKAWLKRKEGKSDLPAARDCGGPSRTDD